MSRAKITKRFVDSLTPIGKDFYVFDTEMLGFAIRVRATGGMSYIAQYKAGPGRGAQTRRMLLGSIGRITPEEARMLAKKTLAEVAQGHDPAEKKNNRRKSLTVAELADLFMEEHVNAKRKDSTADRYRDVLDKLLTPEYGKLKIGDLTRPKLANLQFKLNKTPYQANRMVGVVSSMYSYAARAGLVPEGFNPARGIEKYKEHARECYLTSEELDRIGAAIREAETVGIPWEVDETHPKAKHVPKHDRLTKLSKHSTAAVRLLLFTGARLREILNLRWENVDMERGLLFLQDSKTGKKTIFLNSPALAVLDGLPRIDDYVIASEKPGQPRPDLKRTWKTISKRAALAGVRIHDLRHTFASVGAGASLGLPMIGKLLGHTQASTTQRYAHLDADPLKRASNMIANQIAQAMGEIGTTQEINKSGHEPAKVHEDLVVQLH